MPRSLFPSAFAALALAALAQAGSAQDAIPWMTDLNRAQSIAGQQGKLVLVHFYSDDCRPCKTVERNVFSQAEIAAAISRNYVPVKVNVDTHPQLATRYHVEAWPTDLIVNQAGLEVFRTVSPQAPANYQLMLEQIAYQGGVGAGRSANNPLDQAPWRGGQQDVTLTGAAVPAGQTAIATPSAPTARSVPTTSPPSYSQAGPLGATANSQLSTNNPYATQTAAPNQYAGQDVRRQAPPTYGAGTQAAATDRWAMQPQRTAPPAATPPEAEESIYAGAVQDAFPPVSPRTSAPPDRWSPQPSTARAPAPSGRSASQDPRLPPQLPVQQVGQQPFAPSAQAAQRTSAQFAAPRTLTATQAPPLSIDGFCPVTILETGRWQKGNKTWGAIHRSRTYLFASAEAQRRFLADPDRYAPVLSGCDPVILAETNQWVSGSHNIGLLIGGKTYFFASEETLARFEQSPQAYLGQLSQAIATGQLVPR